MKTINVLILTKYDRLGASSRMRFLQYLPWLEQAGIKITVKPLLSDDMLQARYQSGGYGLWSLIRAYVRRLKIMRRRHIFDVIWIEKEALQWCPLWMELSLLNGIPYILDYDDAVFHTYDNHSNPWVKSLYGQRLDGLMTDATLVVGGNSYLAQRAHDAGAKWVEVLPTVIDLERYPQTQHLPSRDTTPLKIVWIGSPSTAHYLKILREPLQELALRHSFVLRVIGGGEVDLPGVEVEIVPWQENTEVANISVCDIGVMPLLGSIWERGKCGYKLIQYMACGLPVVASNVGVNSEIVQEGENGFLANTPQDWIIALEKLLNDQSLRIQMGRIGRRKVEDRYCIQQTGQKMVGFLRAASGTN